MPRLIDPNTGQAIDTLAIREPQTAHVRHLEREFELHPARGLTPERLARILQDAEVGSLTDQLDLADDMEERDAHLYAELSKRRGAITGLDWQLEEPEGASAAEKDWTARIKEWLGAIDAHANGVAGGLGLVLATMTDAMLKGFAPQEMVWAPQEGVLLPRITAQPQRWFTVSADRRRFLLRSATRSSVSAGTAVSGEELKPLSWLLHVHPARNGYVARMSLLRVLVWPYLFKNYSTRDLAEFLEIYGLPLRVGKYPSGASDTEKRALLAAVTQIGHNAAGIIPQSMALEFEAAAAGTDVPFATMMRYMDAAESKAILGQTLTASEGEHGTQALGNVHNEVRMDIRNADARLIEETLHRQLIQPLALLNIPGVDIKRLPRVCLDTSEPEDLQAYADNLPKLAAAGLKIPVKWAQDKLRIPEPEGDEPVLSGPEPVVPQAGEELQLGAAKPPAKMMHDKMPAKEALAAELPGTDPRDALDDLVDEALADWRPLMAPLVSPLVDAMRQAAANGETLEAFAARLPELVERLDGKPLAEQLARAAFVARLAGEAQLDLDPPQEDDQ
ncbi:MAG: DUF935 domain-containing protein [Burkholderiaceae bacterium]|nr:DUF935 domain-containing protein [Burkholderiaceae bacterium]